MVYGYEGGGCLEEQMLKLFADLRLRVGRSGGGKERSRWSEIYGRQTGKDRWKGKFEGDC